MIRHCIHLLTVAVAFTSPQLAMADDPASLKPQATSLFSHGSRVVFLGDSITYDGRYTHYLEAYLLTHYPDRDIDFINVGLPSEGVTGLSEPAHPFPRPNVHERLARVLQTLKPNLVVACYGMNDGIYYPFSEERFEKYKAGIVKLIADVTATGAKIILITPPPFDPVPVADKTLPADAKEFSWMAPYRGYDEVLAKYSDWLMNMNDPRVALVVDVRSSVLEHLKAKRVNNPGYCLATDGVHITPVGHWLIAASILDALGAESRTDRIEFDVDPEAAKRENQVVLRVGNGDLYLSYVARVPFPMDYQWGVESFPLGEAEDRADRYLLVVRNAPAARYRLVNANPELDAGLVGEAMRSEVVTREELAAGVDFRSFPRLAVNGVAGRLLAEIGVRQEVLGRAWLSQIGHQRPDTPPGRPFDEASAIAQLRHDFVRRQAQSAHKLHLRLEPIE